VISAGRKYFSFDLRPFFVPSTNDGNYAESCGPITLNAIQAQVDILQSVFAGIEALFGVRASIYSSHGRFLVPVEVEANDSAI
jgi:hypothetical protein